MTRECRMLQRDGSSLSYKKEHPNEWMLFPGAYEIRTHDLYNAKASDDPPRLTWIALVCVFLSSPSARIVFSYRIVSYHAEKMLGKC